MSLPDHEPLWKTSLRNFLAGKMKVLGYGAGALILIFVAWLVVRSVITDTYTALVPTMPTISGPCWTSQESDCGGWGTYLEWRRPDDTPAEVPAPTHAVLTPTTPPPTAEVPPETKQSWWPRMPCWADKDHDC